MSRDENAVRRDLAAAYRLAARRGWDDIVWTHLSAAVPGEPGAYLTSGFAIHGAVHAAERARLVAALGALDGLILAHHGTLTVGRTVAEAFVLMHLLERAAQIQIAAMAAGRVVCVSDEVAERTQRQWIGDGRTPEGEDEWPALLRSLDAAAGERCG